jgi:hypothetical protein
MVKVKVKVCFSGTDFVWDVGDIVEVSKGEAKSMVANDSAEYVKETKQKKRTKK